MHASGNMMLIIIISIAILYPYKYQNLHTSYTSSSSVSDINQYQIDRINYYNTITTTTNTLSPAADTTLYYNHPINNSGTHQYPFFASVITMTLCVLGKGV